MQRVTGIGGIFFKAKDPEALQAWYVKHLGLPVDEHGFVCFRWGGPGSEAGQTTWSAFEADTSYFAPSQAPFMVNFRVADLAALLAQLRTEGVTVVDKFEEYDYGKFGWVIDPEGNKVELWQPLGD